MDSILQTQITELMKNNPFYKNFFIKLSLKEQSTFEDYKRVFERLLTYSDIFKTEKLDVFSFTSLESLEDTLVSLVEKHQKISFAKSFLSSKYYHLLSEECYDIFYELKNKNISREVIQSQFINKIAAIKTPKLFLEGLKNFLSSMIDGNIEKIIEKAKKYNTRIIIEDHTKKLLAIEVLDYKASKALGSSSWCISYSQYQFENYSKNKDKNSNAYLNPLMNMSNHIVFFYNFNVESSNPLSLVGVTYNQTFDNILYAMDKRDRVVSKENFIIYNKPFIDDSFISLFLNKRNSIEEKINFIYTILDNNLTKIKSDSDIFVKIFNLLNNHKRYSLIFDLYIQSQSNIIPLINNTQIPSEGQMISFLNYYINHISFEELNFITNLYDNKNKKLIDKIISDYPFKSLEEFNIIFNKYELISSEKSLFKLIKFKRFDFIDTYFSKLLKFNIINFIDIPEINKTFHKYKDKMKLNLISHISLFINNNLIDDYDSFFNKVSSWSYHSVYKEFLKSNISEEFFHKYTDYIIAHKNYLDQNLFFESTICFFEKNKIMNHIIITYLKNYIFDMNFITLKSIDIVQTLFNKKEFREIFKKNIYIENNNIKLINKFKNELNHSHIIFSSFYKDKIDFYAKNYFFENYKVEFHISLFENKYKKLFTENKVSITQLQFDTFLMKDISFIESCISYFEEATIKNLLLNSKSPSILKLIKLLQ